MHAWHAKHKREACAAVRRASPTGVSSKTPVGRDRLDAELAELAARARRLEPIAVPADQPENRWGGPPSGGLSRQQPRGGPRNTVYVTGYRNTSFRP